MAKRLACSACAKDSPFSERSEWRMVRLTRPVGVSGGFIDEGARIVCGNCLLPLRDAWLSQARERS